jgi:membrane-bound lytic murein transglycosylase B
MTKARAVVSAIMAVLALTVGVCTAAAAETFDAWRAELARRAIAEGISSTTVDRALSRVQPAPRIIELDRRQPEFTETFWSYLDKRVTAKRVERGRLLLERHRALLEAVHARYGVQPRLLVAFWGLETDFGGYTGEWPLFQALATLAYDERRRDFFTEQLLAALRGVDRGDIPLDAKSSWAGAMGQLQFMPTTYRDHAVDFDGDGRIDLWHSLPDIFASAANYLRAVGWDGNRTWGREVRLPAGFDYAKSGLDQPRRLAEWQALGVRRIDGGPLPAVDIDGAILLPGGALQGPALMTYANFQAIMAWNRSFLYAVAVGHLSDRLDGGGGFQTPRPLRDNPLSRTDVMEMQRLLLGLGYDTGGVDGIVGAETRRAIRHFQQMAALPADGYASPVVLHQLRKATMQ